MAYTKDSLWKTVDWWTILLYLILITCGWFSVCGASYDYGEPNFLDFTTRAGKQLMWIGCSLGLGFVLLMLEHRQEEEVHVLWIRLYILC
jgi:rod shape determining protein RodA